MPTHAAQKKILPYTIFYNKTRRARWSGRGALCIMPREDFL